MSEVERLEAAVKAARDKVSAMCHGEKFRMSIPVRDDDTDIVLSGGLDAALALGAARERARIGRAAEVAFANGLCNAKHWLLILPTSQEKHMAFPAVACDECREQAARGLGLNDALFADDAAGEVRDAG